MEILLCIVRGLDHASQSMSINSEIFFHLLSVHFLGLYYFYFILMTKIPTFQSNAISWIRAFIFMIFKLINPFDKKALFKPISFSLTIRAIIYPAQCVSVRKISCSHVRVTLKNQEHCQKPPQLFRPSYHSLTHSLTLSLSLTHSLFLSLSLSLCVSVRLYLSVRPPVPFSLLVCVGTIMVF